MSIEPSPDGAPPYAIESVDNALRLLLLVRRADPDTTLAADEELGVARSTAHRLLAMLKYREFVVQDSDRRYVPGPALHSMGSESLERALPQIARPHMVALSKAVGETVNLMTRIDTQVRFVESVEGTEVLRVGSRIGVLLPAIRTSGGKVLLADLTRDEVAVLYPGLGADSEELAQLFRTLSLTRRRGYGTNFEETEAGVIAIAAGVRDASAATVAAMSVSAPTVRFKRGELMNVLPALRAACEAVRRDLLRG